MFLSILLIAGFSLSVINTDAQFIVKVRPTVVVRARPPMPSAGHIWIEPEWEWRNNNYVIVDGYWAPRRAGYVYVPGHWGRKRGGHYWIGGHWRRG